MQIGAGCLVPYSWQPSYSDRFMGPSCFMLHLSKLSLAKALLRTSSHAINEIKWLTIFLAIGEEFGSASHRWFSGFAEPGHPPLGELLIHFPVI